MRPLRTHPTAARAGTFLAAALAAGGVGCQDYAYHEFEVVDVFAQEPEVPVDVLIVVDNSHSMGPYQEKLGQNLAAFLTWFVAAEMDYQIAVTSTDVISEGHGRVSDARVTNDTEDAEAVFAEMVALGIEGSGAEMGLHAAWEALVDPSLSAQNADFLRPEAFLSTVFVTDEEDSSPFSVNDYIADLRDLKPFSRKGFNASALVVQDDAGCGEGTNESSIGSRYMAMAERTGGVSEDLCAEDFGPIVTKISQSISRLNTTFYMSRKPDANSIVVLIDDQKVDCKDNIWEYELGMYNGVETGLIVFSTETVPPLGSRIVVRYNEGSGAADTFCRG